MEASRMRTLTLVAIVLATLVVTAGAAAAMPDQVPNQAQQHEHASTDSHPKGIDAETSSGNASAVDDGSRPSLGPPGDSVEGPPVDLPDPVPGFVSELHQLITDHLTGSLGEPLGEAIRGVIPKAGSQGDGRPSG
ncbi:MAG: hypothetical protein ABEJ71_03505 [Halodesulfurarchaeum sp.]